MLGDRNAAMMCYRLLFWFLRARKNGGWVYMSWRDWQAECNLSQSQVKRVHRKGVLEAVGITRRTMKANGVPTTHYGFDTERFMQSVANALEVSRSQLDDWFRDFEQVASDLPDKRDTAQSNGTEHTSPDGRNNPVEMVKTTQSITSSDQQENNAQLDDKTNNNQSTVVAVTNPCRDLDSTLLGRLEVLGISHARSQSILQENDSKRLKEVLTYAECASLRNTAGFVIRALEENWFIATKLRTALNTKYPESSRYISGRFAAFIEH